TRDEELLLRKVANDVLLRLREKHPEQGFEFDKDHLHRIRGQDRAIYLGNIFRDVRSAPDRREKSVQESVDRATQPAPVEYGSETWEDSQTKIVPMMKPKDYIDPNTPTAHLLTREWLADVLICYVIVSNKTFRFVTGWDVDRWGTTADELDRLARA